MRERFWLTGKQLMAEGKVSSNKIVELIMNGLPAYPNIDGQIDPAPIEPVDGLFWLSEFGMYELYFKLQDVIEFERQFNFLPYRHENNSLSLSSIFIDQIFPEIKEQENVFIMLSSKICYIKYGNENGVYPSHEKYMYIGHILALPSIQDSEGETYEFSIHNNELILKVKKQPTPWESSEEIENGNLITSYLEDKLKDSDLEDKLKDSDLEDKLEDSELEDKLEDIDFKKLINIGRDKLLEEINKAKNKNDQGELEEAIKNFTKFQKYMDEEYGIIIKPKKDWSDFSYVTKFRSNKENERNRNLVRNQIKSARKDFKKDMPSFEKYVQKYIKTKSKKTIYTPDDKISWNVLV